jgi:DNA-binding response OmpR family regulator
MPFARFSALLRPSPETAGMIAGDLGNPTPDSVITVLIADDDQDILELVSLGLSGRGYELLLAHDGKAALAMARERKPEVALLDVAMPELDGYEVTSALKNDPATKDTIVILFTARAQESDVEKGYEAGADDYITKPFTLKTLQTRVGAALERARGRAGN